MEDHPFVDLKIDPQEFLDEMDGRTLCPMCGKSRKYYCYTCYVPVQGIEHKIPKVKLPFKIDIIKHPSECDGKSTSGHARVIAPDDVTIYTYPCIPDYPDRDRVVLLFPGDGSINMETLAEKFSPGVNNNRQKDISREDKRSDTSEEITENPCLVKSVPKGDDPYNGAHKDSSSSLDRTPATEDELDQKSATSVSDNILQADTDIPHLKDVNTVNRKRKHSLDGEVVKRSKLISEVKPPFDRVIIIDSTWNQTKRISSDERLKGLTCVELKTRHSNFWRHQKDLPPTYLSTVEAIYYFVRDYHDVFVTSGDTLEYDGRYDNLLFLFTYMYNKIKKMYNGRRNLKAYQQREEKVKSENKA
ncbi:DTW domain-containing protein 1-like [Mizuhopecten yessoensis]|uniref:DTW domain-containing protein 1-like n=1 Tax=Mizuhopecten yessoensis TaxID=6573 RepID=UPI000B4584D2|nr:DTW domain-containing protein 1-like [Mizuhopecten yessoensis]XP_021373968.1 DTW domain-containing protein 1-like [Mizuhopecten yessoensis]